MKTESGRPIAKSIDKPYVKDGMVLDIASGKFLAQEDLIQKGKRDQLNREMIPEREIYAKGSGAFGKFTVTNDISQLTNAKVFNSIGKETKIFVRFSSFGSEKGSADTERDTRGFAIKFYTEDGNWDLVGSNMPVFFVEAPQKFPDFLKAQKRNIKTNCKCPEKKWDFWSAHPESLHHLLMLMSDRGTPVGYRHMNGYGVNTFSMINEKKESVWVKFHLKTVQGIRNFTDDEAEEWKGKDADFAQRDLIRAIEEKDFPKWELKIQIMTFEQADEFFFDPFDPTKTWPQNDFPLINVGEVELNEIPENHFYDVEQSAFSAINIIDGIGYSPDKILQERLLSYSDFQTYRLGKEFNQIAINKCPFTSDSPTNAQMNEYRTGVNLLDDFPDQLSEASEERAVFLDNNTVDWFRNKNQCEEDYYTQPQWLFNNAMNDYNRQNLIANIVSSMKQIDGDNRETIINRQLCHFFRVDIALGSGVAKGLDVSIETVLNELREECVMA